MRLDLCSIDVAEVIQASVDTVRPAVEAKRIELRGSVRRGTAFVRGDVHRLQQVFWNLLSNAVKFTPEGGAIEIQLKPIDSRAQIVIRDTGRGIDPAFLPYVFERFRQGDGAEAKRCAGLGLGLGIARHLVELHGGTLGAENGGLDQGATFTVELEILPDTKAIVAA